MEAFLHNWWFPFLEPCKERLHSYPVHLFMQPSDNTSGCLVTSRINAAGWFFQETSTFGGKLCMTVLGLYRPIRALYARGLVDQPTSLRTWGLYRPIRALYARGLVDQPTSLRTWGLYRPIRALYAWGLVDQSTSLRVWGLYRPQSNICSGTGRLVYFS